MKKRKIFLDDDERSEAAKAPKTRFGRQDFEKILDDNERSGVKRSEEKGRKKYVKYNSSESKK